MPTRRCSASTTRGTIRRSVPLSNTLHPNCVLCHASFTSDFFTRTNNPGQWVGALVIGVPIPFRSALNAAGKPRWGYSRDARLAVQRGDQRRPQVLSVAHVEAEVAETAILDGIDQPVDCELLATSPRVLDDGGLADVRRPARSTLSSQRRLRRASDRRRCRAAASDASGARPARGAASCRSARAWRRRARRARRRTRSGRRR